MYLRGLILAPCSYYVGVPVGLTCALLSSSKVLRFPISLLRDIWAVAPCTGEVGGVWLLLHEAGGVGISLAISTASSEVVWSSVAAFEVVWSSMGSPLAASEGWSCVSSTTAVCDLFWAGVDS